MQDIYNLPGGVRKGETLTAEWQFALRCELWGLSRIARISRPGALYDASISAKTFEDFGRSIGNLSDSDEVFEARVTKANGNLKFPHINGFNEFFGEAVGRREQC